MSSYTGTKKVLKQNYLRTLFFEEKILHFKHVAVADCFYVFASV